MKNTESKPTVSIGITAYNEEANIGQLLSALVNQSESGFILQSIVVISDGSTDRTVELAKKVKDARIKVIDSKERKGQALQQNGIFSTASCDFLILLDADILPENHRTLARMVEVYEKEGADIVSAKIFPLESETFFGKVIDWHKIWKNDFYAEINDGDSVYLCNGAARGFSKRAYQQIRWPKVWSEDAYSYLMAKKLNFSFRYCVGSVFYYRSPQILTDHVRQSVRFLTFEKSLLPYFSRQEIDETYYIPKLLLLRKAIKGFINQPFYALVYLLAHAYCRLLVRMGKVEDDLSVWETSISTKSLATK